MGKKKHTRHRTLVNFTQLCEWYVFYWQKTICVCFVLLCFFVFFGGGVRRWGEDGGDWDWGSQC